MNGNDDPRQFGKETFSTDTQEAKFEKMGRDTIAQLIPTKSDAELAEELKQKVANAYQPFIDLLNEYDKYGLNVQAGVGKNAFGKYQVVQLQVIKVY
jgi:hypothetical protein